MQRDRRLGAGSPPRVGSGAEGSENGDLGSYLQAGVAEPSPAPGVILNAAGSRRGVRSSGFKADPLGLLHPGAAPRHPLRSGRQPAA